MTGPDEAGSRGAGPAPDAAGAMFAAAETGAERKSAPGIVAAISVVLDAPAKINLALHVVGQRADGHHLLESLVTFTEAGDRLTLASSPADRFTVSGPYAESVPVTAEGRDANLVLRARDLLRTRLSLLGLACGPVHLHLEKNLPVASGIGGGSADAAAALIGLLRLWGAASVDGARGPDSLTGEPQPAGQLHTADVAAVDLAALGLTLGADLPMCLAQRPLIARGVGEAITPVEDLPAFPVLLVNPGAAVSTPAVFKALSNKTNPPLVLPAKPQSRQEWIAALAETRNDLEAPALALAPVIGEARAALSDAGAAFSRMSGSGATCFGLFHDGASRDRAAERIRTLRPDWYLLSCMTMGR